MALEVMRMIQLSPEEIYEEYLAAKQYNASIELDERVKNYENFFIGKQWEGVNAPDMDKPVFNILKRVINYFIAMLASDSVGVSIKTFNRREDSRRSCLLYTSEISRRTKHSKNRRKRESACI